jgi:Aldehyde dehydrogenase family
VALSHETLFIGGEWVSPSSTGTIAVHNASTGEHAGTVPADADADIDAAVAAARRAFDDPTGPRPHPPRPPDISDMSGGLERLGVDSRK